MPKAGLTKTLKQTILSQAKAGVKIKDLALKYSLRETTIYGWLKQELGSNCQCNLQTKIKRLEAENQALLKIIGRYRADEETFKKRF